VAQHPQGRAMLLRGERGLLLLQRKILQRQMIYIKLTTVPGAKAPGTNKEK
jgi:hypothetical protein